jgi:putative hydrolase of the HAD superfamily
MKAIIKAVVFDHGGVLSRGGETGTNEKAASRAMGLDDVIQIPDLNEDLKCGRIGNAEYVQEINRRFPDAPVRLTDDVWDGVYAALRPDPLAYEFAARCREAGLRVAMLSSVNLGIAERLRADGSYDGFDPLVLSCEQGCAKPDSAVYVAVEAGLPGVDPAEILLLDDQEKHCKAARRAGWQAIRVDSPEQMVSDASAAIGAGFDAAVNA